MSQNINQIYIANPATSMQSTDLLYLGRSPYGITNDMAITWANVQQSIRTGTFTPITTAGGTTTLTNVSTYEQYFTGTLNQTVVMPVVSTLPQLGFSFLIVNASSGNLTLQSSGLNTIYSLSVNSYAYLTCVALTGTGISSWAFNAAPFLLGPQDSVTLGNLSTTYNLIIAGTMVPLVASTATAGATTTLTANSKYNQYFTGTMNQTVVLPSMVGYGLPGLSFNIINDSTGILTIQSFSTAQIITMPPNSSALFIGISTAVDTAAAWSYTLQAQNNTANSLVWLDLAGTSITASAGTGYIISNAGQSTVTIPATVAEGTVFAVQGKGAAGWILAMNTGQTCHLGSSASSSGGSLTSSNLWDSVQIVCVTANTTFAVTSVIGNITVA